MNYDELLAETVRKCARDRVKGEVASYIPELKKGDPSLVGVALRTSGGLYECGDSRVQFTLQSISKVISLIVALEARGAEAVFKKVGAEPTGDSFNSIVKLETSQQKPLNPMINAGAIAVCSLIPGTDVDERFQLIKTLLSKILGRPICVDKAVYESEKKTGHRNRSLAYFLKDINCLDGDVEEVLDLYFRQCSILVDCTDLANMGMFIAQKGITFEGEKLISTHSARLATTFMVTCGMYNASGEFAVKVGIPAKSGVSGGVLGLVPGKCGIATFGPALDEKGNSVVGVNILDNLSNTLNLSIF